MQFRSICRIKIDGDQTRMMVAALAVARDDALGQRPAHPVEGARRDAVLEARERGLRGQIEVLDRVASGQQLVHGISADAGRIVGVLITAGQAIDALAQPLGGRVLPCALTSDAYRNIIKHHANHH